MNKRGFTLVEVLLTLVVIGVVIAIMLPAIQKVLPDKNAARARKAYNTLTNVVESLVNNPDIYLNGDLGTLANGNNSSVTSFCQQFGNNMVNVSGNVICSSSTGVGTQDVTDVSNLDSACENRKSNKNRYAFKTPDGVYWYGMYDAFTESSPDPNNGLDRRYVVVCIDTDPDDSDVNTTVYGFGVRRDGKIAVGIRMQELLDEDE